jgi:hypothetical protein
MSDDEIANEQLKLKRRIEQEKAKTEPVQLQKSFAAPMDDDDDIELR